MTDEQPKLVLFDWDGTLVDTAKRARDAFAHAFAELGVEFDAERYEACYSPNWHRIYTEFGIEQRHWGRADEAWRRYFGVVTPTVVAQVPELLRALASRGCELGIVTSAHRSRIVGALQAAGLAELFGVVISGDDTRRKKPHPEALVAALVALAVQPPDAVYVGDTPEDISMAHAAGMRAVAVRSAYPSSRTLRSDEAVILESIARVADLWSLPGLRCPASRLRKLPARLAVYGSLAPGRSNHRQIADLRGDWSNGYIEGTLRNAGWGAAWGFPGLEWQASGNRIPVHVLTSPDLESAWQRLDEFEGLDYRRTIVPAFAARRGIENAMLVHTYELASAG